MLVKGFHGGPQNTTFPLFPPCNFLLSHLSCSTWRTLKYNYCDGQQSPQTQQWHRPSFQKCTRRFVLFASGFSTAINMTQLGSVAGMPLDEQQSGLLCGFQTSASIINSPWSFSWQPPTPHYRIIWYFKQERRAVVRLAEPRNFCGLPCSFRNIWEVLLGHSNGLCILKGVCLLAGPPDFYFQQTPWGPRQSAVPWPFLNARLTLQLPCSQQ